VEIIEKLEKSADDIIEELVKKCPRCGNSSANKSNPAGRCSSCLKKLSTNKKKVGHYLHHHKVADDALRRQSGKTNSSTKKSKGLGNRKSIIGKVKSEEKKAGQVVSLDRKDNSKGYSSDNVRGVDPKLNRGRHKVDPKKLANWKKKLKKGDEDLLLGMILEKAIDRLDTETLIELRNLDLETLMAIFTPDQE
jgi:ribosomal protein S27AE